MQREAYLPLTVPDESLRPSIWEQRLMWFPLIGWITAGFLQYARVHRATRQAESQLRLRDHFPSEEWALAGQDAKLAENIARALVAELPWPNHNFLPSDRLAILLLDGDGMGYLIAASVIEKVVGVKISFRWVSFSSNFFDLINHVSGSPAAA